MRNTLKSLGANRTEITKPDGTRVFYSYSTPVAAFVPGRGYMPTEQKYSTTTTRHINQWVGNSCIDVQQSEIDAYAL